MQEGLRCFCRNLHRTMKSLASSALFVLVLLAHGVGEVHAQTLTWQVSGSATIDVTTIKLFSASDIPGPAGTGVFAVATFNVGASGMIAASACLTSSAKAEEGEAKWPAAARPVPGPPRALPAARIHAVKPSPSGPGRVYSATAHGLFVSDDRGESWVPLPVDRTHEEVFSLAVHPTEPGVVIVGRRDGLWKTRDSGRTWIPLAYPTTGPYIPLAVAIAESDPNSIYVATAREGVFRSADGGYRWAKASRGLPQATAGGRPAEIRELAVHPRNPDTAYIAHERHGVYRTTDGGASWHPFDKGLPLPAWRPTYSPRFAFDPGDPDRLYLVFAQPIHSRLVRNRLYVTSATGGWVPVEVDLPPNEAIIGLSVDPATRALHFWTQDTVLELPVPPKP